MFVFLTSQTLDVSQINHMYLEVPDSVTVSDSQNVDQLCHPAGRALTSDLFVKRFKQVVYDSVRYFLSKVRLNKEAKWLCVELLKFSTEKSDTATI